MQTMMMIVSFNGARAKENADVSQYKVIEFLDAIVPFYQTPLTYLEKWCETTSMLHISGVVLDAEDLLFDLLAPPSLNPLDFF
ncbi:hypothetical protein TNCV_1576181 [Trichonephila clavipes]|nr:hypothetical protein TNCV_1576181 [Trichonephila clavipes]